MTDNALFLAGFLFFLSMYALYWPLVLHLTDAILSSPRRTKWPRAALCAASFLALLWTSLQVRGSAYAYITIFLLLLANFSLLYHDSLSKVFFCASSCVLHVMAIRALVTGLFAAALSRTVYEVANVPYLFVMSIAVSMALTNLAILFVIKCIPAEKIRIINQHREQQWFLVAWMSVFNIYLLFNSEVFWEEAYHPNIVGNEIIVSIAILLGLYIVLFFAFQTISLLGYQEKSAEFQYRAERDPLTGVYNKEMTGKLIDEALALHPGQGAALFMIDVDNFKDVNDSLGHAAGDAVLCELAEKLRRVFRANDIVGRVGGDEFIAFMPEGISEMVIGAKAAQICTAFYTEFHGDGGVHVLVTASVGIALFPKDGADFEGLYRHADIALYQVKDSGKNAYQFFGGGVHLDQ